MSDDIQQVQPADTELAEEWVRETDEPGLRAVSACKFRDGQWWRVSIWVMEFIRSDPLESELRRHIADALRSVSGITSVVEEDREVWLVR